MTNYLLNKRFFGGGGGMTGNYMVNQIPTDKFNNINLNNNNFQSLAVNNNSGSGNFESTFNTINDAAAKISPYAAAAKAAIDIGIDSYKSGASNFNKGKAKSTLNILKENEKQANNVIQSYTAGQTDLDTITRFDSGIYSQKDLKTGSDAKNVGLSTLKGTGMGAAAGATLGTVVPGIGNVVGTVAGAIIGGTIGLVSSGIGAISGKNKRERERKKISTAQNSQDFAVDYHNWQQASQLESANNNAAQVQNNQVRQNVLSLVAFGGKLNRKNYLLSDNIPF